MKRATMPQVDLTGMNPAQSRRDACATVFQPIAMALQTPADNTTGGRP
jgi:hypothetical protein